MHCRSCGILMREAEDHGGGDIKNKYCINCAPNGKLRNKKEIREDLISAVAKKECLSREEAKKKVDRLMPKLPKWKRTGTDNNLGKFL